MQFIDIKWSNNTTILNPSHSLRFQINDELLFTDSKSNAFICYNFAWHFLQGQNVNDFTQSIESPTSAMKWGPMMHFKFLDIKHF